ncbi:type III-B CRISPR module RAMP protein Cmr1 [Ktedonobacter racemifer]|uniref:CRISPR-associated RAMP protein, Cmr1 family n=1 Tax=Ktedonobacter racemifer DSM 44963 TaxID=485913 RepID=D6TCK9_KTERA|nr:type III-B CRISPR module RAMP protein Cmr1 [Ktedonobacter racemifer]EFH90026.1 CRISPR-associated RAMP protein, Cmr1 family [Ktedonobacter racemifer DSM 44963]
MRQEVHFHLQTITPLFMAGADQHNVEIRAPSFRGVMRYWLRAAAGGVMGTNADDLKNVSEVEKKVFGTTSEASALIVRARCDFDASTAPILSREGRSREDITGRDYLMWSVIQGKRPYIPPQTPLQVSLAVRSQQKESQIALQRAISSFWLCIHLGGIGTRSRRGAGSLSVISTQGNVGDFSFAVPTAIEELPAYLSHGIRASSSLYSGNESTAQRHPNFDVLRSGACSVWLISNNGRPWRDANTAFQALGKGLRECRTALELPDRKIFGIPVMGMKYPISGAGSKLKRLASPLHLSLLELPTASRQYVGVATLFKTKWPDMSDQGYALYAQVEKLIAQNFSSAQKVEL